MADIAFHHGTRVFEDPTDVVAIRTAQSAVVFLIGTAPDADAAAFPLNTPVLIKGASNYRLAAKLGTAGTLKKALDAIFDQGHRQRLGAYVYVCRVAVGNSTNATWSNLVGDGAALTGVHAAFKCESLYGRKLKPRIFVAPGFTHAAASDGVNAVSMTTQGTGYSADTTITASGGGGHGTVLKPIRDTDGAITGVAIVKPGFGYTSAPTLTITDPATTPGTGAAATATIGAVGNPVAHELEGILPKLRAIAFIDGPDTTDSAAVLTREKYGSDRLYICDPKIQIWDTDLDAYVPDPASARFAGVQVRVDREVGFYKSVSNEPIYGIDGVTRPISYGDQTNYLNENSVGTIVSFGEGYRTWGNRTTSHDFLAVRRTKDFIAEAIEDAYLEFVDKPMNDANLKFMVETGRAFLRTLEAEGYLLKQSTDMWLDPELNEPTEMRQGRITLSVKFEPPPPMEDIRVIAHPNIEAYTLLLDRVRGAIEGGSLSTYNN